MAGMQRILITGATGLLGGMCLWQWRKSGLRLYAMVRDRDALPTGIWPGVQVAFGDLTKPETLEAAVSGAQPDLVVHCAAMTKVDQCQRQPDLARQVNTLGSEALAAAAFANNAGMVHVSTDAVYARGSGPHLESDAGGELSIYATTKLEAEAAVARIHPEALVLRTCLIGWNQNPNFSSLAEWIVATLRSGGHLPGFVDVRFSPLFTGTLAGLILKAAYAGLTGIYNAGSSDGISKYETARLFAKGQGLEPERVTPVSQRDADLAIPRPEDPVMDSSRIYNILGVDAPTVAQEVKNVLAMEASGDLKSFRRFGGYA